MTRRFWFYEKKRGERRTGSRQLASLGEGLLFGALVVLGSLGLTLLLVTLVIPEWRANRHYQRTVCTVLGSTLVESRDRDGRSTFRPDIRIRFLVNGERVETNAYDAARWSAGDRASAEQVRQGFVEGKEYPCWYDPQNPSQAVLVRGYSGWLYLFLWIPLSLLVIGAAGLGYTIYHWGTSAERRAIRSQNAKRLDPFEAASGEGKRIACIPSDADVRSSPGTKLKYRLPTAAAPGWTIFATLFAAIVWNGVAGIFVYVAIRRHLDGDPDWFLTIFMIPFLVVGAMLVVGLLRKLLVATGIGPTRVEISYHPLHPGGRYKVLVSQAGRLDVRSLEVLLACSEKATYRQGTDTRTEIRRVYEHSVMRRERFGIQPDAPFEEECEISIPPGAMHSFKAEHNELYWRLVVRGVINGWPDFERFFSVVVHPQIAKGRH